MINTPLVSIGLAVYNGEDFIERAITSVLKQSYTNWELIIINDGSSDNTCKLIDNFSDSRIKRIDNTINMGVTPSRNKYLHEAKGKYIAVIDADDEWLPTKLVKQVTFLETNNEYALCGTYANRTNGATGYVWQYPEDNDEIRIRLLWGSSVIHSSILIRKSVLDDNQIFYDNTQVQAEDYKLICDCIIHGKTYNIPEVLLNYYEHANQLTTKKNEQTIHSAKAAWYYITKIAGIAISDTYFHSFNHLFAYQSQIENKSIEDIVHILKLILSNPTKWFNQNKLHKSIAARFYIVCSFHSPSLHTLWHYKSSGLLTTKHIGKLFIKHFIKR